MARLSAHPKPLVTERDRVRMKEIGVQMAWGAQQGKAPRTLGEMLERMDTIARRTGVVRGGKDDGGVNAVRAYLPIHKAALAKRKQQRERSGGG